MASTTLTVIQHNVLAWTYQKRMEYCNLYRIEDPDIILINEHGRKDNERIKIYQYNVYQCNHLNEQHAGVAIAVKKSIDHHVIDDFDEDYLAVKVMTTLGPIIISTGYQPPRRPYLPVNTLLRIFRRQEPVLFAGDLNARHQIFNHNNNNFAGDIINNMLRAGSTQHVGPDFKTYITPRASGTPDIVLTNNNFIYNLLIKPGPLTTSDHVPIVMKVSTSPIQVPIPPRYNYSQANWERFEHELSTFTIDNLDHQPTGHIDVQLNRWFLAIAKAMDNNIPKIQHRILPHPRITNEIKLLQTAFNNIHTKARQSGWTPALRNTAKILQNNIRTIMKQSNDRLWEDLLQNTERQYTNPEVFWRQIKQLMGTDTNNIPYLLDPNGRKLTKPDQQANEFRRHLERTFQITAEENANFCPETEREVNDFLSTTQQHQPYNNINLARLNGDNPLTAPITRNTIIAKIRSFKKKKAPGHSKINKLILEKLPINMLDTLKDILNAALSAGYFPQKFKHAIIKMLLKQGKTNVHTVNYRPISLLETACKIYEKILNDRLRNYRNANQLHNKYQHSYRKNRGTISAIALTYQEIAITQQDRKQCNVIFRDISKAFDKVWHNGLKYKIIRMNMPRIFTATLCNFLDNRTAAIQVQNYTTTSINLRAGVPQGSVLAPSLFTVFTGDIGDLAYSQYTAYADDITQVVKYEGPSKQMMARRTKRAIEELNNYEHRWKIRTNSDKFQIMYISKKTPPPITINNRQLRYTNSATLLGLTIQRTGITQHIKKKRIQASTTLRKLKRFKNLSSRTKLHLYKALILPVLDYPYIPMNTIKKSNWLKLQSLQNRALRWINSDIPPYSTTIMDLHNQYNLEPLNVRNFRLASAMWEKIRLEFPDNTEAYENQVFNSTHAWWPLSYIAENTNEPDPIYGRTRQPQNEDEQDDDGE